MFFGLSIPNWGDTGDPRTLASLAHDAEDAGWDGFFLWDHITFGPYPTSDPWVDLAAIALATERVRIGTLVTPLPRRRITKLARETTSIDALSHGRLILGVGIGAGPWEWEQLGEPADLAVRVGFANYFERDFNVDHAITEVYDAADGRWKLVDPELSPLHVEQFALDFDPLEVPLGRFIPGGLAWQRYRSGDDPKRYGVAPGSEIGGSWFIMDKLVQDLATQNKIDLLLWDAWGMMLDALTREQPSADDLALLDHAAEVTQAGPDALDAARALYASTPRLAVPDRVMRFSPAAPEPAEVAVAV